MHYFRIRIGILLFVPQTGKFVCHSSQKTVILQKIMVIVKKKQYDKNGKK